MKRKHLLLCLSLLAGLLLTACAGVKAPEAAAAADQNSPVASVAVADPAPAMPAADLSDLNRPYINSDLSLVGTTGRPQFLNSHATW